MSKAEVSLSSQNDVRMSACELNRVEVRAIPRCDGGLVVQQFPAHRGALWRVADRIADPCDAEVPVVRTTRHKLYEGTWRVVDQTAREQRLVWPILGISHIPNLKFETGPLTAYV